MYIWILRTFSQNFPLLYPLPPSAEISPYTFPLVILSLKQGNWLNISYPSYVIKPLSLVDFHLAPELRVSWIISPDLWISLIWISYLGATYITISWPLRLLDYHLSTSQTTGITSIDLSDYWITISRPLADNHFLPDLLSLME